MVGDANTVDLLEKCLHNLTHNPVVVADKDTLEELDTFVNAVERLHVRTRDWHAGLAMMQSIINTFWDGFLQPLVKKKTRMESNTPGLPGLLLPYELSHIVRVPLVAQYIDGDSCVNAS